MRISCPKDDLLRDLQVVARGVSQRSSVQILSGILFDAGDGERPPLLAATDMELSVRAPLEAEVSEGGRAVLPGRLAAAVRKSSRTNANLRATQARSTACASSRPSPG